MLEILVQISDLIWNPMAFMALGVGFFFTVLTKGIQFRRFPDMIKSIFEKKSADDGGTSPLQAILLTIGGRVGVGNIAGVGTAISAGGPGALFWMMLCSLLGAASAYAESVLAQVFKERALNEHRGGMPYYVEKGLKLRWLAVVLATMTFVGYGFVFPGVQANSIAVSMDNAFGVSTWISASVLTLVLGLVIWGGTQRIVHVAQVLVPIMAPGYLLAAFAILVVNADQIWPTIVLVMSSAFGTNAVFGGIMGTAVAWGVRRSVFSNVAGVGEGTYVAASASVRHPSKQGLAQALSIFVDTTLICSATGVMIIMTGMYNTPNPEGGFLYEGVPGMSAGPANTQAAIDTIMPGMGPGFLAVALFFFAFTTMIAFFYIATTNLVFLGKGHPSPKLMFALKLGTLAITFFGCVASAQTIWTIGDIGYGSIGWVNMICILMLSPMVVKVTRDYDAQMAAGKDPVFDPRPLGIENADFWVAGDPIPEPRERVVDP
ncbi:MAG: alanine/glycine:cation symporter family protein [Dermatophilus congolensis]|nr:alanine/glycine:cation symporter family protein [Dermatophilus congolensis]